MFPCNRRARTFTFICLSPVVLVYVAYNTYLIIAAHIERKEICEKLNMKYRNCNLLSGNPRRAILQELLREWIKIASSHNISYALSFGSLLGQFRDGDVIPWDLDVDIMLEDTSLSKLQEVVTPRNFTQGADKAFHFVVQPDYSALSVMRRWSCDGQVVNGEPDHCSFIGPIARLIKGFHYVDIFGLKVEGNFAYVGHKKKNFKLNDIFPTKDCLFMDIKTKCPQNVMQVLEVLFHSVQQPCTCNKGKWILESWWKY